VQSGAAAGCQVQHRPAEENRALGHRLAARWLDDAGESEAVVLADHLERGGQPARAIEWYLRAAEQALEGNDFTAALERAEHAVRSGAAGETLGALRLIQADAHRWRGESRLAEERAHQARRFLAAPTTLWLQAAGEAASASAIVGNVEGAREAARALLAESRDRAMDMAKLAAFCKAATRLYFLGEYRLADALFEGASVAAPDLDLPEAKAWRHRVMATKKLLTSPGTDYDEWVSAADAFEQAGDLRNACVHRLNAAEAMLFTGGYAEAESAARELLAVAERLATRNVALQALQVLGQALEGLGRLDEPIKLHRTTATELEDRGSIRMAGRSRAFLARTLKRSGELVEAEREARIAGAHLRTTPPSLAFALAVLAEILLARKDRTNAYEAAKEALALLERLGSIDEGEIRVWVAAIETASAVNEGDLARTILARAHARLLVIASGLDGRVRDRFLTRVEENARLVTLASARPTRRVSWNGVSPPDRAAVGNHHLRAGRAGAIDDEVSVALHARLDRAGVHRVGRPEPDVAAPFSWWRTPPWRLVGRAGTAPPRRRPSAR
jgi:eukaryotic-like serine/threonine-protein kinase